MVWVDLSPALKKRMDAEIRAALSMPDSTVLQNLANQVDEGFLNKVRKQYNENQRTNQQTRTRKPREGDNDP